MIRTPRQLVSGVVTLLSLPQVYLRLEELLQDRRAGTEEMGQVLRYDPAVSARLLKVVNSAFYGFPSRIDNLPRAITVVGTQQLKELVLSMVAASTFSRIGSQLVDMASFWHHSVYCGLVARVLARRCNILHPERLFTAGLLHDVGQLIIYHELPEPARQVLTAAADTDDGLYRAERAILGFTHAEVASELFREWRLPNSLRQTVAFHHEPAKAGEYQLEAAIVHLANSAANRVEPGRNILNCAAQIDPEAWQIGGLSEQALTEALDEAHPQFLNVIEIIAPGKLMV